jgi:hypothetical protein
MAEMLGPDETPGPIEIEPENRDTVRLFFALSTQWRFMAAGLGAAMRAGLDYAAIEPTARLMGLEEALKALFPGLQLMEAEALAATAEAAAARGSSA